MTRTRKTCWGTPGGVMPATPDTFWRLTRDMAAGPGCAVSTRTIDNRASPECNEMRRRRGLGWFDKRKRGNWSIREDNLQVKARGHQENSHSALSSCILPSHPAASTMSTQAIECHGTVLRHRRGECVLDGLRTRAMEGRMASCGRPTATGVRSSPLPLPALPRDIVLHGAMKHPSGWVLVQASQHGRKRPSASWTEARVRRWAAMRHTRADDIPAL